MKGGMKGKNAKVAGGRGMAVKPFVPRTQPNIEARATGPGLALPPPKMMPEPLSGMAKPKGGKAKGMMPANRRK